MFFFLEDAARFLLLTCTRMHISMRVPSVVEEPRSVVPVHDSWVESLTQSSRSLSDKQTTVQEEQCKSRAKPRAGLATVDIR